MPVLRNHHTWNFLEIPRVLRPFVSTTEMTWFCRSCEVQNSQSSQEKESKPQQIPEARQGRCVQQRTAGRAVAGIPREGPMDTVYSSPQFSCESRSLVGQQREGSSIAASASSCYASFSFKGIASGWTFTRGIEEPGASTWHSEHGFGFDATNGSPIEGAFRARGPIDFQPDSVTLAHQQVEKAPGPSGRCSHAHQDARPRVDCLRWSHASLCQRTRCDVPELSIGSSGNLQSEIIGTSRIEDRGFQSIPKAWWGNKSWTGKKTFQMCHTVCKPFKQHWRKQDQWT